MHTQDPEQAGMITRVNVTPIIDVALVLVIILLVTAPLITVPDRSVQLPEAHTRGLESERNVSVTLGTDGSLAIDKDAVTARDLRAALAARLALPENDNVLVLVRADEGTPYTQVGALLEEARAAGAKRLGIATRQAVREEARR